MLGTVCNFNRLSGFGFIAPDDPNAPNFFTCSKFIVAEKHRRFLFKGWRVEFDFDPATVDIDPVATNVRIISRTIAKQIGGAL
jgi:cold shock CspA family protein